MPQFYQLRGALFGRTNLIEKNPELLAMVQNLLRGNYTSRCKRLVGVKDLYSLHIDKKARLLFTFEQLHAEKVLLILEYLPNHEYHRSRFLRSKCALNQFLNTHHSELDEQMALLGEEHIDELEFHTQIKQVTCSDGPVGIVDYHKGRFIELNANQHGILAHFLQQSVGHLLVKGVAGAGKTSLGMSFLAYAVTQCGADEDRGEAKENQLPLMYISYSQALVEDMKLNWAALPLPEASASRVVFKSVSDLFAEFGIEKIHCVTKSYFETWYLEQQKKINKREAVKTGKSLRGSARKKGRKIQEQANGSQLTHSADTMYQEFYNCAGYDLADYLKISDENSLVLRADRAMVYQMHLDYRAHLQQHKLTDMIFGFDQDLEGNPKELCKRYQLMVVDEAQDASTKMLQCLSKLACRLIFNADPNQNVSHELWLLSYLNHLFAQESLASIQLSSTFRCPLKVAEVANVVVQLKHQLVGGFDKNQGPRQIEAIESDNVMGEVYLLTPEELLHPALTAQEKGTRFAVVTHPDKVKAAIQLYQTPLVFTPETIKGLEFDCILAYGLFDEAFFKEAKVRQASRGHKQALHKAKAGERQTQWGPLLNGIHTAWTRARHKLLIGETQNRHTDILWEPIRKIASTIQFSEDWQVLQTANRDIDWLETARELLSRDPSLARVVLQKKLRWDETQCSAFEAAHFFKPSAKDPAPVLHAPNPRNFSPPLMNTVSAVVPKVTLNTRNPTTEEKLAFEIYAQFSESKLKKKLKNLSEEQIGDVFLSRGFAVQGKQLSLIEIILSESHKWDVFTSFCANNAQSFLQIPLKKIGQKKTTCLKKQKRKQDWATLEETQEEIKAIYQDHPLSIPPICIAVKKNLLSLQMRLVKMGADLNVHDNYENPLIFIAAEYQNLEFLDMAVSDPKVDWCVENSLGETLASYAAAEKLLNIIEFLVRFPHLGDINRGKKLNDKSFLDFWTWVEMTPLLLAIQAQDKEMIHALAKHPHLDWHYPAQTKPVFFALCFGLSVLPQIVEYLQQDLNKTCMVGTQVMTLAYAAAYCSAILHANPPFPQLVFLSNHKTIDWNQRNPDGGCIALNLLDKKFHKTTRYLLKKNKLDLHLQDHYGRTPLFLAAQKGHRHLVALMLQMGACKKQAAKFTLQEWDNLMRLEFPHLSHRAKFLLEMERQNEFIFLTPEKIAFFIGNFDVVQILKHSDQVSFSWTVTEYEEKARALVHMGKDELAIGILQKKCLWSKAQCENLIKQEGQLCLKKSSAKEENKENEDVVDVQIPSTLMHQVMEDQDAVFLSELLDEAFGLPFNLKSTLKTLKNKNDLLFEALLREINLLKGPALVDFVSSIFEQTNSFEEHEIVLFLKRLQTVPLQYNVFSYEKLLFIGSGRGYLEVLKILDTMGVNLDCVSKIERLFSPYGFCCGSQFVSLQFYQKQLGDELHIKTSPYIMALMTGNYETADYILQRPGKRPVEYILSQEDGETIQINAILNSLDVLDTVKRILLQYPHLNWNKPQSNGTLFACAAVQANEEKAIAELMRHQKLDLNQSDSQGQTPLWIAVENNHFSMVCLLLKSGADPLIGKSFTETDLMAWVKAKPHGVMRRFRQYYQGDIPGKLTPFSVAFLLGLGTMAHTLRQWVVRLQSSKQKDAAKNEVKLWAKLFLHSDQVMLANDLMNTWDWDPEIISQFIKNEKLLPAAAPLPVVDNSISQENELAYNSEKAIQIAKSLHENFSVDTLKVVFQDYNTQSLSAIFQSCWKPSRHRFSLADHIVKEFSIWGRLFGFLMQGPLVAFLKMPFRTLDAAVLSLPLLDDPNKRYAHQNKVEQIRDLMMLQFFLQDTVDIKQIKSETTYEVFINQAVEHDNHFIFKRFNWILPPNVDLSQLIFRAASIGHSSIFFEMIQLYIQQLTMSFATHFLYQCLFTAARYGQTEIILAMDARFKLDFSYRSPSGETLAFIAASTNNVELTQQLIDKKIDFNRGYYEVPRQEMFILYPTNPLLVTQFLEQNSQAEILKISPYDIATFMGYTQIIDLLNRLPTVESQSQQPSSLCHYREQWQVQAERNAEQKTDYRCKA